MNASGDNLSRAILFRSQALTGAFLFTSQVAMLERYSPSQSIVVGQDGGGELLGVIRRGRGEDVPANESTAT